MYSFIFYITSSIYAETSTYKMFSLSSFCTPTPQPPGSNGQPPECGQYLVEVEVKYFYLYSIQLNDITECLNTCRTLLLLTFT